MRNAGITRTTVETSKPSKLPTTLPYVPYVVLAIGTLATSLAGALIKLSEAPAVVIAAYRLTFATILLAPVALVRCRGELSRIERRDLGLSFLTGLVLAFHFITWVSSLKYTTVASAVVLAAMHPFFVAIGARILYREVMDVRTIASSLLAFAGILVMGMAKLRGPGSGLWGNALALMAAIGFAGYLLMGQKLRQRMSVTSYVFMAYGVCGATLMVAALATGTRLWPYSSREFLIFGALALIPTVIGHTSFNWALGHVRAMAVSVTTLMEPVLATVVAFLLVGEHPTGLEIVGGMVTLSGTLMFLLTSGRRRVAEV